MFIYFWKRCYCLQICFFFQSNTVLVLQKGVCLSERRGFRLPSPFHWSLWHLRERSISILPDTRTTSEVCRKVYTEVIHVGCRVFHAPTAELRVFSRLTAPASRGCVIISRLWRNNLPARVKVYWEGWTLFPPFWLRCASNLMGVV